MITEADYFAQFFADLDDVEIVLHKFVQQNFSYRRRQVTIQQRWYGDKCNVIVAGYPISVDDPDMDMCLVRALEALDDCWEGEVS